MLKVSLAHFGIQLPLVCQKSFWRRRLQLLSLQKVFTDISDILLRTDDYFELLDMCRGLLDLLKGSRSFHQTSHWNVSLQFAKVLNNLGHTALFVQKVKNRENNLNRVWLHARFSFPQEQINWCAASCRSSTSASTDHCILDPERCGITDERFVNISVSVQLVCIKAWSVLSCTFQVTLRNLTFPLCWFYFFVFKLF